MPEDRAGLVETLEVVKRDTAEAEGLDMFRRGVEDDGNSVKGFDVFSQFEEGDGLSICRGRVARIVSEDGLEIREGSPRSIFVQCLEALVEGVREWIAVGSDQGG